MDNLVLQTRRTILMLTSFVGIPIIVLTAIYLAIAPPAPPEATRRVVNGIISINQTKLSAILHAEKYCIVGKGGDVYIFARRMFPDFKLESPEDKWFLRSDTHWHLILVAITTRTYQILPIDVNELDLAEPASIPYCAQDFLINSQNAMRLGKQVRIFDATPLE